MPNLTPNAIEALAGDPEIVVGDNQPYAFDLQRRTIQCTCHRNSIPVPAFARTAALDHMQRLIRQKVPPESRHRRPHATRTRAILSLSKN